ncbi:MAG TPA: hypothetical protein DCL38_07120 [Lachnospiraceae bacterium]|nr:hypothetical protein [Lachnospiraceae bacterium]
MIEDYTREAGVRGLKKRIDTICRSAAVKLVENYKEPDAQDTAEKSGEKASAESASQAAPEDNNSASQTAPEGNKSESPAAAGENGRALTETEEGREETLRTPALKERIKGVIDVNTDNLKDFLDMSPVHHKFVKEKAKPGIITGLAWTSVGGDILYIETMFTKGSGQVIITGQLGDVMKESAKIAVSLVKSVFPEKAELFSKNDLHIHVPDGATPKDGPSAGITLTIAIASLATGNAVTPRIAMTGEVSLQGNVNPIGGLPEKLMAAHRAGVRKVFIPKDNEFDLKDVASEVREALEIIPVSTVEDVLNETGVLKSMHKSKLKAV